MLFIVAFLTLLESGSVIGMEERDRIHHQELRDQILLNYPRKIPPKNVVEVDVTFAVIYVRDLKVDSQTFSLFGYWLFEWEDTLLKWNLSDESAPNELTFDSSEIWTPHIILSNNAQTTPLKPDDHIILASGNGDIKLFFTNLLETECHVDVTRYPFDEQTCDVSIVLYFKATFRKATVTFVNRAELVGESVEWRLLNTSAGVYNVPDSNPQKVAVFIFELKREYLFYLMTVIVPIWLLSVMNACVFLLPVESGEKISYLISILVTYSVFINYTNEVMPKSGTPSRLGIYLVLVLCESCAAILVVLGVLNTHYKRIQASQEQQTTDEDRESVGKAQTLITVKTAKSIKLRERHFFIIFLAFSLLSPIMFFL